MKVTREMVAAKAGVSKQTVSYYYNKTRYIAPETIKRIEQAISELDYIPNSTARALSQKKSSLVAVVCNRLSNPHYTEIIAGIANAAGTEGLVTLVFDAEYQSEQIVDQLIASNVYGAILLTFQNKLGLDRLKKLDKRTIPYIVTHSAGIRDENHFQLEPDYYPAIHEALVFLKNAGHTKIAMLSAYDLSFKRDVRLECYLRAHNEVFGSSPIIVKDPHSDSTSMEQGEKLSNMLLDSHNDVTGVFVTNDLMCIGAIDGFKKRGKSVPDDISVIGTDNMEFGKYTDPKLTTIGYDKFDYGRELFLMLQKAKKNLAPELGLMPVSFIKRNSASARI